MYVNIIRIVQAYHVKSPMCQFHFLYSSNALSGLSFIFHGSFMTKRTILGGSVLKPLVRFCTNDTLWNSLWRCSDNVISNRLYKHAVWSKVENRFTVLEHADKLGVDVRRETRLSHVIIRIPMLAIQRMCVVVPSLSSMVKYTQKHAQNVLKMMTTVYN